jgi:hypothetical protein
MKHDTPAIQNGFAPDTLLLLCNSPKTHRYRVLYGAIQDGEDATRKIAFYGEIESGEIATDHHRREREFKGSRTTKMLALQDLYAIGP